MKTVTWLLGMRLVPSSRCLIPDTGDFCTFAKVLFFGVFLSRRILGFSMKNPVGPGVNFKKRYPRFFQNTPGREGFFVNCIQFAESEGF